MRYLSTLSTVTVTVVTLATMSLTGCSGLFDSDSDDPEIRTYEVTIENMTDSQPLSPGIFVAHSDDMRLFAMGEMASEGIRLIAESGDPSMAMSALSGNSDVQDVRASDAPIGPGGMLSMEIEGREGEDVLSIAVMLVCTNDGFTGVESVELPTDADQDMHEVMAYDAGTEMNEETSETIVDGCGLGNDGNARTTTNESIAMHEGIQGIADLDPDMHGWTEPVARITVQRME